MPAWAKVQELVDFDRPLALIVSRRDNSREKVVSQTLQPPFEGWARKARILLRRMISGMGGVEVDVE